MSSDSAVLWSWLVKRNVRNEIYSPEPLGVDIGQFRDELQRQIEHNGVPADVHLREIVWDDTSVRQQRIIARPTRTSNDVLQMVIGLDDVGKFSYVEEKLHLRPPVLPKKPGTVQTKIAVPKVTARLNFKVLIAAIVALVIGISVAAAGSAVSVIFFIAAAGLGYAFYGPYYGKKQKELQAHNEAESHNAKVDKHNTQVAAEEKAWNKAWSDWHSMVLDAAYLETTDDVFGRLFQALSSTVRHTIKKLYEDRNAELRHSADKEYSKEQLEKQLEEKKKAFS